MSIEWAAPSRARMENQQQQQQATKPTREQPLDTFIPRTYMALLEGTMLANGDLKVLAVVL